MATFSFLNFSFYCALKKSLLEKKMFSNNIIAHKNKTCESQKKNHQDIYFVFLFHANEEDSMKSKKREWNPGWFW